MGGLMFVLRWVFDFCFGVRCGFEGCYGGHQISGQMDSSCDAVIDCRCVLHFIETWNGSSWIHTNAN